MLTMISSIIQRKCKKYISLILGVTACFLFIIFVDAGYQASSKSQLINAYSYEGQWDVCAKISNEFRNSFEKIDDFESQVVAVYDTTYNLRLDPVPDDEIVEAISYVEYRYLAVWGIEKSADNIFNYELIEGRYPEKENEIVIPSTLQYHGKAADKGTIRVGDHLTFLRGRRIDEEGMYTQGNVTGLEIFEEDGEKEYVVCGIIEYIDYHTTVFTLNGFVGMQTETDKSSRELTVYYKLDNPSLENIKGLYQTLSNMDGVIAVDDNSMVVNALEIMEKSDYVRTIKYGVYIFEMLLALIGLGIIAVEQYQTINDDRIMIKRMHCIGAEKRQLYLLYSATNAIVLLVGYLLALFIGWGVLAGVAKVIVPNLLRKQTGALTLSPDILYISLLFFIMIVIVTLIICRSVSVLLPERTSRISKVHEHRQSTISSLWGLAANKSKSSKKLAIIKTVNICIVMICVPLFVAVSVAAYATARGAAEFFPFDYGIVVNNQLHKNIEAAFDEELSDNENIKDYFWISWDPRKIRLEKECFPDDVYSFCANGMQRFYFEASGDFYGGIYLCFIGEEFYSYLNELNRGTLPSYEEFESGDNCIIWAESFVPKDGKWNEAVSTDLQEGEWISFGKNIAEHMDTISFEAWIEGYEDFKLNVFSSVNKSTVAREKDGGFEIRIYAPEWVYEKYCEESSTYVGTEYCIWGYDKTFSVLNSNLNQMKERYDFTLMDYVTERNLTNDTVLFQLLTSVISIFSAMLLCCVATIVLEKIEYISERQSLETYKTLGLGENGAFVVRMCEHVMVVTNAVLISIVVHYIGALTFMRRIFSFYQISVEMIGKYFIPTILVILFILVLCSLVSTKQMYRDNKQFRSDN